MSDRQFDAAKEQARKILELEPTYAPAYWALAYAHEGLGEYEDVCAVCRAGGVNTDAGALMLSTYVLACTKLGHNREAQDVLERLLRKRRDGYFSAFQIGLCYFGLGDVDRAIDWMKRAHDERDGMCTSLNVHPPFDPLRSDPRFQALLKKMNFPASADQPSSSA